MFRCINCSSVRPCLSFCPVFNCAHPSVHLLVSLPFCLSVSQSVGPSGGQSKIKKCAYVNEFWENKSDTCGYAAATIPCTKRVKNVLWLLFWQNFHQCLLLLGIAHGPSWFPHGDPPVLGDWAKVRTPSYRTFCLILPLSYFLLNVSRSQLQRKTARPTKVSYVLRFEEINTGPEKKTPSPRNRGRSYIFQKTNQMRNFLHLDTVQKELFCPQGYEANTRGMTYFHPKGCKNVTPP